MKKTLLFLSMMILVFTNIVAAEFIIDDFESRSVGYTYQMKAWYPEDGTATVAANPTSSANKAVNIVTTNWDAMLKLSVTLPSGTTLADYESFSFDIYIGTNANDENPNYKNMFVYLDDEKKFESTDYPKQADVATWTTKTFTLASLALTPAELAKSSFTIAFGMSTDKGNYFIDNVKLIGGGIVPPPPTGGAFTIADFNDKTVGATLDMKKWYPEDGTATVAADPANASNKVVNVVTSNWDAILKLNVTLPAGKTLADYESFSFDIYIGANANDENPNYKNMFIYLDDEKKFENTDYPKQADVATWTTKTFTMASLALTPAELAKSSFSIAFGMSTDKGNYYIDNVKLTGGGVLPPPPGGILTIADFNDKSIGATLEMKEWYPEDGTATIAADPANSSNKVVNIVTTNWDAFLKLNVTLPSGKTLANFESLSFDIYIPSNANDENPNYKNMFIYLDDEKKFENTDYPKQADVAVWTTKTFELSALALTSAENAKSSFDLAFGISTDKGNYYIDNVKMKEKTTGLHDASEKLAGLYISGNTLHFGGMQVDKVAVYDLNGSLQTTGQNLSSLDLSPLNAGIYIVKAVVDGKAMVGKVIK